jgi:hypothetical protein
VYLGHGFQTQGTKREDHMQLGTIVPRTRGPLTARSHRNLHTQYAARADGELVKMSGRHDATGGRCRGGTWRTRSTAGVAARQVVATHGMAEVEPVWPQDEVAAAAHGVVEP